MKVELIQKGNLNSARFVSPKNKNIDNINQEKSSFKYSQLSYNPSFMNIQMFPRNISFMGHRVYIVDGGNHATNMQHFVKAIAKDIEIKMYDVQTNPKDKNIKQLKSLEQELKTLNSKSSFQNEYVAVPALASVPILNMQDQYNRVMCENKKFCPENLKANKKQLLQFLKKIYENPESYRQYINYMDSNKQGLEYSYGVIQEINKLKQKGANIYVPSGHPQDETLKWLAGQRNLKPELYHFIATGEDKEGIVEKMHNEIKSKNWYDFNLLSLSDANVVGVKGSHGAQDYMFAAYDSCITDGARGVYNFSPVRENNKLIGYSYTNTYRNEYPYEEFSANDEIKNLVKFVGKYGFDVVASKDETKNLKRCIDAGQSTINCPDKLYPIKEVFSPDKIKSQKMDLQGRFVDKTLNLFFDTNQDGKVIFPKCDCEGSGKPSVISMWGSCFSVFNAIARDISLEKRSAPAGSLSAHNIKVNELIKKSKDSLYRKSAEDYLNNAIETDKGFAIKNPDYFMDYKPHYLLGQLHLQNKNLANASSCYNNAIRILSKEINKKDGKSLSTISKDYQSYMSSKSQTEAYDKAMREFRSKSPFLRFFASRPQISYNYNDYLSCQKDYKAFYDVKNLSDMYLTLSSICKAKGEEYPAKICQLAAEDIAKFTQKGDAIIERRAEGVEYIGDLYD